MGAQYYVPMYRSDYGGDDCIPGSSAAPNCKIFYQWHIYCMIQTPGDGQKSNNNCQLVRRYFQLRYRKRGDEMHIWKLYICAYICQHVSTDTHIYLYIYLYQYIWNIQIAIYLHTIHQTAVTTLGLAYHCEYLYINSHASVSNLYR